LFGQAETPNTGPGIRPLDYKSGLGLYASAAHFLWGERDDSMISPWFGLKFTYRLNPNLGLELYSGFGYDRPRDTSVEGISGYLTARPGTPKYWTYLVPTVLNAKFQLAPNRGVSPYLLAGTGVLLWEVRKPNEGELVEGTHINGLINFGFGSEFFFTRTASFDLGFQYHHLISQQEDMSGLGDDNTGNIELRAGINFYFGTGSADPDGDGIPNKRDNCPEDPEDKDGFEDADGCPDLDNDQDGIADERDECPGQAEDIDGFEDEDGCPDPDNDGDGIPDTRDDCPGLAEDVDGFEDSDGCPDTDNDGDGIPDDRDECPDEAETKNDYQDNDGCPDERPQEEVSIVKKEPVVLEGVNFEFNSAQLQQNSKRILDMVVKTLQSHPAMKILVSGHTDSRGSAEYNRQLSQDRAESVKQYLVSQGIAPSRIETMGMGESKPIAPNDTAEGRERNRRIEIIRID